MKRMFSFITSNRVTFEAMLIGLIALALRVVNLKSWPRWYVDERTYG